MMKVKPVKLGKTERMSFSHIDEVISMPNLIEVQKNSYQWFLDEGLKEVFHDIGTIEDYTGNLALSFVDFRLDKEPKYSIKECKERDVTYAAPLRVTARLLNKETGEVKDQEIFMGDFPLMTDAGTFVINGAERAIVSQLVRSPGVFYGHAKDKVGNDLYSATMNPNRGAWLEYETDAANVFYVRIDKNRKLPVTVLCRALGLSTNEDILNYFGEDERILATLEKDTTKNREEGLLEVYRKLRPGEPPTVESATSQIDMLFFDPRRYDLSRFGRYKMNKKLSLARRIMNYVAAENVVDPFTGEILVEADKKIERKVAEQIDAAGVDLVVLKIDDPMKDKPHKVKVITNGCVDAQAIIDNYYPAFKGVDVKECGINERCNLKELRKILDNASSAEEVMESLKKDHDLLIGRTVTIDDILSSINYLNDLGYGIGTTDDIDHLGNRRIRSVGELLQNQFRIGFSRMERVIRERMTLQSQDQSVITPQALINIRPVVAAIKEFFGSSPLSQFMDQNNPLAELTHKRRLSALGPGGLSRDRAGFEVRDVHYSHYGRMCPIETPEGPNIGLISYLATYARINEYGFIEAPYRAVDKETGKVAMEATYMTADEEDNFIVAQATEPIDEDGCLVNARVTARYRDEIVEVERERIDYVDVSPRMMVSIATAMIPFLPNDDANRALMGANMQRQAVPLLKPHAPIVGTGMEHKICIDSEIVVLAEGDGVVTSVDARHVTVKYDSGETKDYKLTKFLRSNHTTCINQHPIVDVGERVHGKRLNEKGEWEDPTVLADGPATDQGEIALGQNILVGFMTWEGYNYEDAVLLNEKIVREDVYTSIHIEEYETESRDTKLGPEEITRDIPNVSEDALKDLDERGIIRIGAEVKPGDILVGKITPKSETELAPEERLLRAIFGEKAAEVKDTSLRVPSGCTGIVMDVRISSTGSGHHRGDLVVDSAEKKKQFKKINDEHKKKKEQLIDQLTKKLSDILLGEKIPLDVVNEQTGEIIIPANRKITKTLLRKLALVHDHIEIEPSPIRNKILEIITSFEGRFTELDDEREHRLDQMESGDESEPGGLKEVKVYIAAKRKLGVSYEDIDVLFAGDLLNQCISSSFAARGTSIPFLGLYGACSTMGESLALAAMSIDGGFARRAAAMTSSHFCTAERQYRMPVPYGSQRTPTAQWTATAAGCCILSNEGRGPAVTHAAIGRIVDRGITDANNMGAAMAPAAYDTLRALFSDTRTSPADYDLIVTGDLGRLGHEVVTDLFARDGVDMTKNYKDCGLLLYDLERQDMHMGGSGCGCSAAVLNGYLLDGLRRGRWRRLVFAPTGALLSPTSSFQGESVPGICHAVVFSAGKEGET